jgi:predicted HicB family RNase H-like nuclease
MAAKVKRKYIVGPDVDLDLEVVFLPDGSRLTNKLAAKMARDAIKQVRGRPSLTAVAVESPQLKVRVPAKLKKAIEKEAKRRGETTSTIVREVLQERFLQNH